MTDVSSNLIDTLSAEPVVVKPVPPSKSIVSSFALATTFEPVSVVNVL